MIEINLRSYPFSPLNPYGFGYPFGFYGPPGYIGSGSASGGDGINDNTGNGTSLSCDAAGCCWYSSLDQEGPLGGPSGGSRSRAGWTVIITGFAVVSSLI